VTREALHTTLARWLPAPDGAVPVRTAGAADTVENARVAETLLDHATLDALRALPPRGERDMLSHIAESYLADSQRLFATIERALGADQAPELARAAHAWRSCNGHIGALSLVRLCRELEACGRAGDLRGAPALLAQIRSVYARVREELQREIRRSA